MRQKRFFRSSLLLALALLVPLLLEPLAHASTYVGYGSANCSSPCGQTGWTLNYGVGNTIQAPFAGVLVSVGFFTGSGASFPTRIIILTTTASVTGFVCCGNEGAITDNTFSFTVADNEALSGLSATAFFTITLASPVTVTNGQFVAVILTGNCNASSCLSVVNSGPQTSVLGTCFSFGSNSPGIGSQFTALTVSGSVDANCNGTGGIIDGASFNPAGSGSSGGVTVTQCYGNCGNPAITLANTNSTHTINFNQTITLFYQFQSNVNGFLLNVTTSMAKSYVTLPNGPAFGVYTITSCPLGQSPFSPQCPGLLQAQSPGQNFFSPPKGKISFSGLRIPVFNGQWVGIALSAFSSGLDVNDTNTNVNLFQTNEGKIPPSIQSPASLGNSKVGLWAWINGNVVTGGPPTFPSGGNCGPGLDLILSCVVTSSCSIVTLQCQTGASIFWVIILTIFTLAITLGLFSYWLPNLNLSTKGMGEFAVLIFIGWFAMFGAIGLLLPWLMILLFFVVAWLFMGRAKGTGPI